MITWRPMTETPTGPATALIRVTDEHDVYLLPGPVMWDTGRQRWEAEDGGSLRLDEPGETYHWVHEYEVIRAGKS